MSDSAPYQAHSETSREAAESIAPELGKLQRIVLDALREHGPMTDEQLQAITGLGPSTERPRRIELVELHLVEDSGQVALTRSKRKAVLWCIARPKGQLGLPGMAL